MEVVCGRVDCGVVLVGCDVEVVCGRVDCGVVLVRM